MVAAPPAPGSPTPPCSRAQTPFRLLFFNGVCSAHVLFCPLGVPGEGQRNLLGGHRRVRLGKGRMGTLHGGRCAGEDACRNLY